ncbi:MULTISPECIES: hypothetical protein [unclassified Streptomyces]|uniref:hypothetical protein n=1 Tax=unclassified Streptomyces TaxID=2593676 RepID=UPI000CD4CCE1|nr:hypothetical protein [Streptomyces sp. SM10]
MEALAAGNGQLGGARAGRNQEGEGKAEGAACLGAPDGIRVREPVTTRWHRSDAALERHTG